MKKQVDFEERLDFEALDLCDDPDCKYCVEGRKKLVKFICKELCQERDKMGDFLLKHGHGGGNWRRLIISYLKEGENG